MADIKSNQEILKQGIKTDFWKLLVDGLDESIKRLQNEQNSDELRDMPADQYKVENEIIKASIANLKDLKELPENIISWLEDPNAGDPGHEFDPYAKDEDFEKK